ncbi:hypothetical protein Tco_0768388, partial [Tanacetum coccineum]
MYKERVRILEGINKDNNYLNEFLEADERAKRYNRQAQSQFVHDRDIIRDLEKQQDKLELDVKDYKRQKEEYQANTVEQLHVFDSVETLEDAEKSQLKMNEFQKDEKVQELKIQPIDYGKLNKLYDNFVPQKELSA